MSSTLVALTALVAGLEFGHDRLAETASDPGLYATDAAEQQRLCEQTQAYLAELTSLNEKIAERPWDGAVRTRLAEVCDKLDKPDLAAMWRQAAAASLPGTGR